MLKKIKAQGFHEATCGKVTAPDEKESAWIEKQLQRLQAAGVALHAEGTLSDADNFGACIWRFVGDD